MLNRDSKIYQRLEEFRKKFYLNQMVRGSLILLLLISSILFIAIMGEGLLGFSSGIRTGLFFSLLAIFGGVLGWMVIRPAAKYFNLANGISDMDIAKMVRKHFPDIDDKLINLLELSGNSGADESLALAAIEKKTEELSPIPISTAINIKLNFRYLKYLAIPLGLFALLWLWNPELIMEGSTRLINYKKDYPKPQAFYIDILNHPEELISGQDYDLDTKVKGRELPSELYLYLKKEGETEFINYPMEKLKQNEFRFEFSDIKEKFSYYIGNQEVESDIFDVEVLKRPSIRKFRIVMKYPGYTGIPADTLSDNIGDFKALKGTKAEWILEPNGDIERAVYVGSDTTRFENNEGAFMHSRQILEDESYFLSLTSTQQIDNIDTVRYHVEVLNDRFPSIYVNNASKDYQADFRMEMPLDFEVTDDYGFSKLSMFYRFIESDDASKGSPEYNELKLNVKARELVQNKSLAVDLFGLGMEEGDKIEYFIKVWDNDYVSGPKHSVSSTYTINNPSINEQFEEVGDAQEGMKDNLEKMLDDAQELKEGFKKMQERLLNQKNLNYDDKKELQNLLNKHENVAEQMEELQKKFEQNKQKLQNNQMISEQTLKKYEMLNEYMEKMDNPLLDELRKRLEENMEELDSEDIKKAMEEIEMNEEEMEQSIERTMELLKQLEVEQKTEELMQKLDNLQSRQEQLNEQLEKAKNKEEMDKLAEKQEKLNEDMEKIKEDLEDLKKMKEETSTPEQEAMDELKKDAEDTKQDMEQAGEQMKGGKKNKGSESQKGAAQKMQKMKDALSQMQMSSNQQQDEQNLENLREIIENLIRLSFKQEDLREEVRQLKYGDPMLPEKGRVQKQLQDDMEMVKDSLDDLAKKVFQLEKFITDETKTVIKAMKQTQSHIREKQTKRITNKQTESMTSINNLANMLSDVMQQMQQQMKNAKPGQGACKKPSGSNPNMGKMGEQQKELNGKMKEMFEKLNGKGGKPDPKSMAEMAAKQEMLRKQLKKLSGGNSGDGGDEQPGGKEGDSELLGDMQKIMEDMKKTEEDLINQQLSTETIMRQEKILNRLLDANKAVREKNEFENRRESNTGKEIDRDSPAELEEEQFKNMLRQEMLKSNELEYSNDFINLIEKYYKLLEGKQVAE